MSREHYVHKTVNKCNFENLILSVFSNTSSAGVNFFNKTASAFIYEEGFVSVTNSFLPWYF